MKKLFSLVLALTLILTSAVSFADTSTNVSWTISYVAYHGIGEAPLDVTLHYGINGWNDVKDISMTPVDSSADRVLYESTVTVPRNSTVDYCFKITSAKSVSWENNANKDFHTVVNESLRTAAFEITYKTDYYTSRYTDKVVLHHGLNDWNNAQDIDMTAKYNYVQGVPSQMWFGAIVTANEGDTVDYCFNIINVGNLGNTWLNNNGNDYHKSYADALNIH